MLGSSIPDARVFAKSCDDNNKDKDTRPIEFYLQFDIISLVRTQLYSFYFYARNITIFIQHLKKYFFLKWTLKN